MDAVETSGKSIDDAILQALVRLGRRRDEVEVVVLQEPSHGVRGVGAKEARVRVWVKRAPSAPGGGAVLTPDLADQWLGRLEEEEEAASSPPSPPAPAPRAPAPGRRSPAVSRPAARSMPPPTTPPPARDPAPVAPPRMEPGTPAPRTPMPPPPPPERERRSPGTVTHSTAISRAVQSPTPRLPSPPEEEEPFDEEEAFKQEIGTRPRGVEGEMIEAEAPDAVVQQALQILQTILQHMRLPATVEIADRNPLTLNIRIGGNTELLGMLIGRRGDTLASLQLIVNLMLNHQAKERYHVLVDAEYYRQRRDDNLRSLAARVGRQVQQSQRAMALEPMTPYERRIVHMALQDSPYVQTQSTGEGDQRRVVISPRSRSGR